MSVRGEFTRSANLLLEFLQANHPAAVELGTAVAEARDRARQDISGGAEAILALEESGAFDLETRPSFAEEQEERLSHLLAIAKIILGR